MTKKVFPVMLLLAALIGGCSKPEDKFVGMWDGKMEYPPEYLEMMKGMMEGLSKGMKDGKGTTTPPSNLNVEELVAEMNNVKFELELKKDGACSMSTGANGQKFSQGGTWTLSEDGKSIAVKMGAVSSVEGKPISSTGGVSQEITYKIAEDNKSMVFEQDQMGIKMKMSFAKR